MIVDTTIFVIQESPSWDEKWVGKKQKPDLNMH